MSNPASDSYLSFPTAGEAKQAEDALREQNKSFRTQIIKTRRRGLEYRVMLLDGA